MKAAVYKDYGDTSVIQFIDMPVPKISDKEVLIKVAATSFNFGDIALRQGMLQTMVKVSFPFVPCLDVSGTVDAVGSAVTNLAVGDKVYAYLEMTRNGAAAEYVAAKAAIVAKAPKSLPLADTAALPVAVCTTWQGLFDHGNLQSGQRVLIVGAAGGVGTVAIQLAKSKGAQVVAVDLGKHKAMLRELGADEVIDYTKQPLVAGVTAPVDLVLDLTPSDEKRAEDILSFVKKGGAYVMTAVFPPADKARQVGVRATFVMSKPSASVLSQVAELVDAGKLRPVITERARLEDLKEVQGKVGTTSGKILIVINQ